MLTSSLEQEIIELALTLPYSTDQSPWNVLLPNAVPYNSLYNPESLCVEWVDLKPPVHRTLYLDLFTFNLLVYFL